METIKLPMWPAILFRTHRVQRTEEIRGDSCRQEDLILSPAHKRSGTAEKKIRSGRIAA